MESRLINFIKSLPVLEPLCLATASQLKPLPLNPVDHLEVDLNDDGRYFAVNPIACYKGMPTGHPASSVARVTWLRRVPEKEEKPKDSGNWMLAATDFTALVMANQWPEDRLIFKSENAKALYQFLLTRFLVQTKTAIIGAEFKLLQKVPVMPVDFVEHPDPDLRLAGYQKVPLSMSLGQEAFALFMQQGTGKTPICVARLCLEARRARLGKMGKSRMLRVLIICPRQARTNWHNEIDRFAVVAGKTVILRGGKVDRMKGVVDAIRDEKDCEFGACICSYESIENTWSAIGAVPWDLVVADESHYIKNDRAQRTRALHKLRDVTGNRMILTGTPIVNHLTDLWAQFEFLSEGLSGFLKYSQYKKFYGLFEKAEGTAKRGGLERLIGMKNVPLIQERLSRISFSITKKEAGLNLPDKVYDMFEVQMARKQREYYVQLQKQIALEIKMESKTKTLTADHILTKMLRLAQITSGHIKWDPIMDDEGTVIDWAKVEQISRVNPKVEACVDIIKADRDADPNSKTIIFATFREDLRVLEARFKQEGINHVCFHGGVKDADREIAITRYNMDPKCEGFLGNQKCCSEALNLLGYDYVTTKAEDAQTYTTRVIYFSQNWSPVERAQSEDRAHRRGTACNLQVTDLVVPGTVDEQIRKKVAGKRTAAEEVQDIKDIMRQVLETDVGGEDE